MSDVTLTLLGNAMLSTMTDGTGNYVFSTLAAGGNYDVTPSKTALGPGSAGIDTIDALAAHRHYLNIAPLTGCPLLAADVNRDAVVNTLDVIAIQWSKRGIHKKARDSDLR